jgi:hypothetical protein
MKLCDGISVVTPTESHFNVAKMAIADALSNILSKVHKYFINESEIMSAMNEITGAS